MRASEGRLARWTVWLTLALCLALLPTVREARRRFGPSVPRWVNLTEGLVCHAVVQPPHWVWKRLGGTPPIWPRFPPRGRNARYMPDLRSNPDPIRFPETVKPDLVHHIPVSSLWGHFKVALPFWLIMLGVSTEVFRAAWLRVRPRGPNPGVRRMLGTTEVRPSHLTLFPPEEGKRCSFCLRGRRPVIRTVRPSWAGICAECLDIYERRGVC